MADLCSNSCSITTLGMCLTKELLLQVVGVSERRPVRRAGALLVVTARTTMMMLMEQNDPVIASENDVLKGHIATTILAVLNTFFFVCVR